jgi:hypothetical protein
MVPQLPARDVAPDLRWYVTPCGIGDYLCVFMAVGEFLSRWPDAVAHIAYNPHANAECILGWDRVQYILTHARPEGYWEVLQGSSRDPNLPWWLCGCMNRRTWFERLGLDWERKRMHYRATEAEEQFAARVWGLGRPRVSIGWHGTNDVKVYPHMREVVDWFVRQGANVVGLDQRGESQGYGRALRGSHGIRDVLAVPATADMHVGICSGPSYAAIGANVPTVLLLPYDDPDEIFEPVVTPSVWSHWKYLDLAGIPLADVLHSCAQMWEHVTGHACR